jgi:hypothetical protein
MNFILLKNGMKIFDKFTKGVDLLTCLAEGKWKKQAAKWTALDLKVAALTEKDYLGYAKKSTRLIHDLLFTRTFLKEIRDLISPALIRVLCAIAAHEFNIGKRFREQGEMKSLLVPNTHQQKVLEFCPIQVAESGQSGYILLDINDSIHWNYHGKIWALKEEFARTVYAWQRDYEPIYQKGLDLGR